MSVNKPYKVTFVLDHWELVKEGQSLKIRGLPITSLPGGSHITTPPLIRYDEEQGWAETQTCLYKLLKRKEVSRGDRLEEGEASEQQVGASGGSEGQPLRPGMVRKA